MIYQFLASDFQEDNYVDVHDCPVARVAVREGMVQKPSVSYKSLSDYDNGRRWAVGSTFLNGEDMGTFCYSVHERIYRSIRDGKFQNAHVEIIERN